MLPAQQRWDLSLVGEGPWMSELIIGGGLAGTERTRRHGALYIESRIEGERNEDYYDRG